MKIIRPVPAPASRLRTSNRDRPIKHSLPTTSPPESAGRTIVPYGGAHPPNTYPVATVSPPESGGRGAHRGNRDQLGTVALEIQGKRPHPPNAHNAQTEAPRNSKFNSEIFVPLHFSVTGLC